MKNKKSIIVVCSLLVIVLIAGYIFMTQSSGDEKLVKDLFEEQMSAIQGDTSDIDKSSPSYAIADETQAYIDGIGFNENQLAAAKKAISEFDYKIESIETISDDSASQTVVEVTYTVSAYPIVDSLNTEYLEKPENHLSDAELKIFNGKDEDKKVVIYRDLITKYNEELSELKPVDEEPRTVVYVIGEDDKVEFRDSKGL